MGGGTLFYNLFCYPYYDELLWEITSVNSSISISNKTFKYPSVNLKLITRYFKDILLNVNFYCIGFIFGLSLSKWVYQRATRNEQLTTGKIAYEGEKNGRKIEVER